MNYGFYISASGMMSSLHRQDVAANNLANVNTVGFKPDVAYVRDRLPERLENGAFTDPQELLEQLSGGVHVNPTWIDLSQGGFQETKAPLDIALDGPGFLTLSTTGEAQPADLRFSRDGRLTINAAGELVSATSGLRVLGEGNQTIRLDPTQSATILENGAIVQGDGVVARLQLTAPPADQRDLEKLGANLFAFSLDAAQSRLPASDLRVQQGMLETSGANPITTLNAMIAATKAVSSNARMMQYQDQAIGQAVSSIARVR